MINSGRFLRSAPPAIAAVILISLPSLHCGTAGTGTVNGLPSSLEVTLPDGTQTPATLGSGVLSLADTTWQFFRTADNLQGGAFVTVRFGSEGQLLAFENSTIAPQIFGTSILFDGQRHNTTQAGLQYAAATYGAESADATGFAFEGRLKAFAAGLEAATATASATATYDAADPNVIRGTFRFKSEVTLLSVPDANVDDEFSFLGRRVTGP